MNQIIRNRARDVMADELHLQVFQNKWGRDIGIVT